jgi:hypothetical protein
VVPIRRLIDSDSDSDFFALNTGKAT